MTQSYIKRFFLKEPTNRQFWLAIAFIAKFALFLFKIFQHHTTDIEGFWGSTQGDTPSYLDPVDNFIKNGNYAPDWRMPGYGAAYLPFIIFFSKATACNLVIIVQLLLSAISVYVLALTAKGVFKSNAFFYATFYLYAISDFSNLLDTFLLTESLTVSFLIFSTYFLFRYFDNYNKTPLFLSGLFLTWVIFMRPVIIVMIVFFYGVILIDSLKNKRKFTITLLFVLPFVLIDGLWVIHNFKSYKKIIPLTTTVPPDWKDSYILHGYKFVESWGGNVVWWDKRAEIRWFGMCWGQFKEKSINEVTVSLPDNIYTSEFNKDSLETLRKMIFRLNNDSALTDAQKTSYNQYLAEKFDVYARSVKKEKPILYYIIAPLKILKTFIVSGNKGTESSQDSGRANMAAYLFKLFYSIFYIFTIALGSMGIFLLFKDILKFSVIAIIPFIPLYIILIHACVFRLSEYRYLVPAFPFMLVCAIYTAYWGVNKFKNLKIS